MVLLSSYSTGVAACILTADWVQGQCVVPSGEVAGQNHCSLVPDVGGVVTQTAGGVAGQCHSITLRHFAWGYQHLQIWDTEPIQGESLWINVSDK